MEYKVLIEKEVEENLKKAEKIYNKKFGRIPVLFTLKGKTAGMYHFIRTPNGNCIGEKFRFNLEMCELNGWESFRDTVPHEVAHHVCGNLYPNAKPHGREWKSIMFKLGYRPDRTHSMKAKSTKSNTKQYLYTCHCGKKHKLSELLHKRVQSGIFKGRKYYRSCTSCKEKLRFIKEI